MLTEFEAIEISINDSERWNKLIYNSFNSSIRSSLSFENTKHATHRKTTSFLFNKNGEDIAGAHYSLKNSFAGIIVTADILSGIVFKYRYEKEIIVFIIKHFTEWAKMHNVSVLRISPWLPLSIGNKIQENAVEFHKLLLDNGFVSVIEGRNTYWIDLTHSEEELLANMNSSTRAKIRKAIRSDIEMQIIRNPNAEIINEYWEFYSNLGNIKGFHTISEKQFKAEVLSLLNYGQAELFFTRYNDTIVNIALASNFGQAMYYHGAINPNYKNLNGCPAPGHFAQWSIIKCMKSMGLKIYDMAFCPGAIPDENHPNYNMWKFKHGFGGMHILFMPTYMKILKPIRGKLFEKIRYRQKRRLSTNEH